jgi:hypothetical protein
MMRSAEHWRPSQRGRSERWVGPRKWKRPV